MKKAKAVDSNKSTRKTRPALSPESRENQLIAFAVDLAEQQLRDGTASSQVITHFLKLGSTKAQIEKLLLEKQAELAAAKAESVKSIERRDEMYRAAINAMRKYSGEGDFNDEY